MELNESIIKEIYDNVVDKLINEGYVFEFGNSPQNDYEFIGTFQSIVEHDSKLSFVGEEKIGNYASFTVFVYPRDNGYIPHVHIRLTNEMNLPISKLTFDCCVKLETNEYFKHGTHQSTMTSRQCKDFNTFMNSMKNFRKFQITHYEFAVDRWNENSERENVKIHEDDNGNLIIPNYSTII